MEEQMKAICEGRSTRNDVVQQNLEQYRAVFNRTVQQINVLKSVRVESSLLLSEPRLSCVVGSLT